MTLAKRTITPAAAAQPDPSRTRVARYDYRSCMKASLPRMADVGPTRTQKVDGDIEISSTGTFIWQDGMAVPYRKAGA